MFKWILLSITLAASSIASAQCGQGYVAEIQNIKGYGTLIVEGSVMDRLAAIENVTRDATISTCFEVQLKAISVLSQAFTLLRAEVATTAIEGVRKIAAKSTNVRVKVGALEAIHPVVNAIMVSIRTKAIQSVESIAEESSSPEVVSKALEVLVRAQNCIFTDARELADKAVKKIEATKKY